MSKLRCPGRHRKRSAAAAALAATGVGATVVAGTVLGAGVAHAATTSQWDQVASCESSGNWAADTGNHYYGGLQFSQATWDAYGGTGYAPLASEATPSEQMTVANRVLADQGWGAWPVCSREVGVAGTATGIVPQSVPAVPEASVAAQPSTPVYVPAVAGANYSVRAGDSLSRIAAAHGVQGGWPAIYLANRAVIGNDPNLILPGMRLRV